MDNISNISSSHCQIGPEHTKVTVHMDAMIHCYSSGFVLQTWHMTITRIEALEVNLMNSSDSVQFIFLTHVETLIHRHSILVLTERKLQGFNPGRQSAPHLYFLKLCFSVRLHLLLVKHLSLLPCFLDSICVIFIEHMLYLFLTPDSIIVCLHGKIKLDIVTQIFNSSIRWIVD